MWFAPSSFAQASGCSQKAFMPACATSDLLPALWVTSSGTPTPRRSCWPGWKRRPWSQLLYGPGICRMSDGSDGLEQWIASLRDSLASRTAWPEAEKAPTTIAGSGRQSATAFAWFDRGSSSWKTSPGCDLLGEWLPFSQTWSRSGFVSNGTACERLTWAPAISASGCSSWATSDTNTSTYSNGRMGPNIREQVVSWPTPASRDAKGENSETHATLTGVAESTWTNFRTS